MPQTCTRHHVEKCCGGQRRFDGDGDLAQEAQAGTVINGRYRLVKRLGAGGFGRVWSARDEMLGIDVAVKEVWLPPAISEAERSERLVRAEREARNAARLRDHPNIVAVYDVVVADGAPWLVMQLVVGQSLEERLHNHGPVTQAETLAIATGILSALEAAHAAGIVHRDVKPGNVLLTDDGKVLLADFGIAVHQADTALTATGAFIGSMEYVAPERARGTDGLAASDLFSLGATLYQAVEGFSPFRRDTPTGSLTAVLFEEPPEPRRATEELARLLIALLTKDPEARPSAQQALAVLGQEPKGTAKPAATAISRLPKTADVDPRATVSAPNQSDTSLPAAPTQDAMPLAGGSGRRRMKPRMVVVAGVVLAVAAGAGIWWAHSGSGAQAQVADPSQAQLEDALLTQPDFGTQYPSSFEGGYTLDTIQYVTNGVCPPMDKTGSITNKHTKPVATIMYSTLPSDSTYRAVSESIAYYGIDDAKKMMTLVHQEDQCATPFQGDAGQEEALFPLVAPTSTSDDCAALDVRVNGGSRSVENIVVARVGGVLITFDTRDNTHNSPDIIDSHKLTAAVDKLHAAGITS